MKNLELEFLPRFRLVTILGLQTDMPLADMVALHRIFTQTAFTEAESAKIDATKKDIGGGNFQVVAPSPDFGHLSIEIEDTYAAVLDRRLESPRGATIHDVPWIQDVKRQLKGA